MDKAKISADATRVTGIFLAAQERMNAISAVNWALQKLLVAYGGNFLEEQEIQGMIGTFIKWQGDRPENLKRITGEYMNEASRLTSLLMENE